MTRMLLLSQLPERDRQALLIATIVILAAMAYWWLWEPVQADLASERSRVQDQLANLREMQTLAHRLKALSPAKTPRQTPVHRAGSLHSRVDSNARRAGISGKDLRMEPRADGRLRVRFTQAELDKVLAWLDTLRRQGIQVYEFTAQRKTDAGIADIRLVLQDALVQARGRP